MEYTMMVASTRGSVKWAMLLGAPAEKRREWTWVRPLQIRGCVLHTRLSPAYRLGPHPPTCPLCSLPDATSDKVFLVTPTIG